MNNLSFQLFRNTELLSILIISFIIITILFLVYKLLKKKDLRQFFIVLAITALFGLVTFWNLGSLSLSNTTFQPIENGETVTLKIDGAIHKFDKLYAISGLGDTNANPSDYQIWFRNTQIVGSNDLVNWTHITTLEDNDFFKWTIAEYDNWDYQYIKLIFPSKSAIMTELGLYNSQLNEFLPLSLFEVSNPDNPYNANFIFDENDLIPLNPTYMDESYFDEIYHARNALEISQHQYMYAHVHPLLGTWLISLGIDIFGVNLFGFRFMGALVSVLLVPLFYLLAKKIFRKDLIANLVTILFACDFMHLTTGRIATLEPFSILFILAMYYFMVCFIRENFMNPSLKKTYIYLGLSGLMMALAWATKWTGIYASAGLALVFFTYIISLYLNYKNDQQLKTLYWHKIKRIIPYCVLVFVVVPVIVYFLVYTLVIIYRAPYTDALDFIKRIIEYTQGIFSYHSKLVSTHPFESRWYTWLVDARPIWYYFNPVENGLNTISCFNNPLISWMGIFAIIYTFIVGIKNKSLFAGIILLGYFSSLVPWMFISRSMYLYHYYPSFPFLILAIGYMFNSLLAIDIRYKKPIIIYVGIVIAIFILFLPVTTGFKTDMGYINTFLRWFESWYFGH